MENSSDVINGITTVHLLCDDDEVTVNSKFYLSTKVFPVDSYEASLSVILKDNSVVVNELQPNYRFVACATERLSKDVKITADSDDI